MAIPFRGQKYLDIKRKCQKDGQLFVDPEFQPHDVSLFYHSPPYSNIEWRRPGEIAEDPHLFVEGVSSDDVTQGLLGNCWFVAACSVLTHHEELWGKIVPDAHGQEWNAAKPQEYCGVFHFCFWQFGQWFDVVIDDLLPTQNGHLIFARSKTRNEFWSALLEKACAKFHGCYEALIGGNLADAFVDITGGVPETLDVTANNARTNIAAQVELFDELKRCFDDNALMAAAIAAKTQDEIEETLECGLVKGHCYAITDVRELKLDAKLQTLWDKLFATPEHVMMIRLRNPWGQKEWNGPWSDNSEEWSSISEDQQGRLGLKFDDEGEFWMTFEDFCRYFTEISVCHQFNTKWFSLSTRYHEIVILGSWKADLSEGHLTNRAGGCVNFRETFLQNPQYMFTIPEKMTGPVLLSLMQKEVRHKKRDGHMFMTIGLHVLKVEENRKYRLHLIQKTAATSEYVNTLSVFLRLNNPKPGRYVVLPTTYAPGDQGDFMLRFFSQAAISIKELKHHGPNEGHCRCLCKAKPAAVTRVMVCYASGLQKHDTMGWLAWQWRKFRWHTGDFRKWGLQYWDGANEWDPIVEEAVRRLPHELIEERNQRMLKAMILDHENNMLPREKWTKWEDPYIEQVEAEALGVRNPFLKPAWKLDEGMIHHHDKGHHHKPEPNYVDSKSGQA